MRSKNVKKLIKKNV